MGDSCDEDRRSDKKRKLSGDPVNVQKRLRRQWNTIRTNRPDITGEELVEQCSIIDELCEARCKHDAGISSSTKNTGDTSTGKVRSRNSRRIRKLSSSSSNSSNNGNVEEVEPIGSIENNSPNELLLPSTSSDIVNIQVNERINREVHRISHNEKYYEDENDVEEADEENDDEENEVKETDDDSDDEENEGEETSDDEDEDLDDDTDSIDEQQIGMFGIAGLCNTEGVLQLKQNITQLYLFLCTIAIAIRGKITYVLTIAIFKFLNSLFHNANLPRNKEVFWKAINAKNDQSIMIRHLYCRKCHGIIGQGKTPSRICECKSCGPNEQNTQLSYYIQIKIAPQLQQIFTDPALVNNLEYRFKRTKNKKECIEDIYDGRMYKAMTRAGKLLHYKYNYSFTIFTDGCQVTKSSKCSAWPVFLQINEFSPHVRKRIVILAAIWVDSSKMSNLNSLLMPVIEELNELYNNGITWIHPTDGEITSKFVTLICTADTMARAPLLNMTLFNGDFGCTFCHLNGIQDPTNKNQRKYEAQSLEEQQALLRSHESILHDMRTATPDSKVRGTKGYSALCALPEFDLARGNIVDSMHCVNMGVAKHCTQLFMLSKYKSFGSYYGRPNEKAAINERLLKIRMPSIISRRTRKIDEMNNWKASEWRNWVQYTGLISMNGIIGVDELKHFAKLSTAAYILNKNSISTNELHSARQLLTDYTFTQQEMFSVLHMRYNVHLLSHLFDTVNDWGPCWAYNAYNFESWNKKIIDKVTAGNAKPLQITRRYLLGRFIESFFPDPNVDEELKIMLNSILTNDAKKQPFITDYSATPKKITGMGKKERLAEHCWQYEVVRNNGYQTEDIYSYKHIIAHGVDFRVRQNENEKKTTFCNSFVYCQHLKCYGEIINIITFHEDGVSHWGFLLQLLSKGTSALHTGGHIRYVEWTEERKFIHINNKIPVPAIMLEEIQGKVCITKVANCFETD